MTLAISTPSTTAEALLTIPPDVTAAVWADVKRWFTEARPSFTCLGFPSRPRAIRLRTISISQLCAAVGVGVALYKYLNSYADPARRSETKAPAAKHLPCLVEILRLDHGYQVPAQYENYFPPLL